MSGGVGVEGSCLGKGRQDRGLCRGPEVRSIEHLPGTRHFPFLSRRFSPPPWAGHLIRSPGSHRWLVEKPGFKPGHSDPKACVLSTASLWDGRFSEKWKEQSQTIRSQIHSKQQGAAPPGQGRAPTLSIDTSSPCTCPQPWTLHPPMETVSAGREPWTRKKSWVPALSAISDLGGTAFFGLHGLICHLFEGRSWTT